MRLALAKYHRVDELPALAKEDFDRLHAEYMAEMTGTTPLPSASFNLMFTLWKAVAKKGRYFGFRNVKEHCLNIRYPDEMPDVSTNLKASLVHITYSIPTFPALLAMVDTQSQIAEVGAGSGYLAEQLAVLGADVVCCDVDVDKQENLFHPVEEMDGRDFIRKHDGFPDRALLICWGYYKDGIPEQYEEMVRMFKGDFLFIIGEQRADLCTFCLAMCEPEVREQWERIATFDLPAYEDYGLYDQLVIYKRAGRDVEAPTFHMRPTARRRDLEYL